MATFFATDDEDLVQAPTSADEEKMALRNARYGEARGSMLKLQDMRVRQAQSDLPPGSPTNYLDTYGKRLGPIEKDEFGLTKPAPLAATGLRGYPSTDEIRASIAAINQNDRVAQFENDVGAYSSRYPGAPKFQMPSTDDLIDAGIQNRRNQIEQQMNLKKARLGLIPPSAAGLSGVTLDSDQPVLVGGGRYPRYAPSQATKSRAELALLGRQADELDRAQQANIAERTKLAIQSAKDNESAAQDTARGQVVDFLNNIDQSRYPVGSPDREALIGRVFGNRPDWLHVMAKDKNLSKYVQDHIAAHDTVAQTMAALKQAYPDVNYTPSITSTGKVSFRGAVTPEKKEQDKLTTLLHKTTGLTPDEFAAISPDSVKAGGIFAPSANDRPDNRQGTFHDSLSGFTDQAKPKGEFVNDTKMLLDKKYAKTPWDQVPQEEKDRVKNIIEGGGAIQIDTGKGYKAVVPRALFERYKAAFGNKTTGGNKVISVDDWLNQGQDEEQ